MTNAVTKPRQIDVTEIKTTLIDSLKSIAICSLSDDVYITSNGQGDGFIEVIEQVDMSNATHETMLDFIARNLVHCEKTKSQDSRLSTAQSYDIFRDCYHDYQQSDDAKAAAVEIGLI
jgi:hypothetical protein